MFLRRLTSSDERFKRIDFDSGLNLIVADRIEASNQGNSRNGTGKSSLIRILRYVLGSDLPDALKVPALKDHRFRLRLTLPGLEPGVEDQVMVTRSVSPTTRVEVRFWSATGGRTDLHVSEWRELLAANVWSLPEGSTRPSVGQLWAQFIRNYYGSPTKVHGTEADWETGVRLGYLLGLDPDILSKAGEVSRLTKQRTAIRKAVQEGVISHVSLDDAGLRADLATARRTRDRIQDQLRSFRVDDQYLEHQRAANDLTTRIRDLNDEVLSIERRVADVVRSMEQDVSVTSIDMQDRLARVYDEVGIVLPELVARRFDEVADFHASVISNRRAFLQEELVSLQNRVEAIDTEREALDEERAGVMQLLRDSVALETFLDAQTSLSRNDATVADLERRLESANSINEIDGRLRLETVGAVSAVRTEVSERSDDLDGPIGLFSELGDEIYSDRIARLLISTTTKGILKVDPEVSGDASSGIRSVETFLLDMVSVISAIERGCAPGVLVHDSHLFDSIDHRQVATCLSIGARMADQHGFQYIVTMNTDFLGSVVKESDGVIDADEYLLTTSFTDATEDGGLFGFRFE